MVIAAETYHCRDINVDEPYDAQQVVPPRAEGLASRQEENDCGEQGQEPSQWTRY